jgi:hypothetical protein
MSGSRTEPRAAQHSTRRAGHRCPGRCGRLAVALGADMVSLAREAMFSIGCIQAQRCHTGECRTGIATQHRWLSHGLDPAVKSVRAANHIRSLRRGLLKVFEACGASHPSLIGVDLDLLSGQEAATPLRAIYGYKHLWGQPSVSGRHAIDELMARTETT